MLVNKNQYLEGVIEFTEETEVDGKINFLDLTLHVDNNGKIRTDWYTKPIASNRLVNYYSAHPPHMKFNIAKSFIRKILTISHRDFHPANRKRIFAILMKNNFPIKLIERLYSQVVNKHLNKSSQHPTVIVDQQNQRTKRKSYPFLPDQSIANSSTNKSNAKFSAMTYIPGLSEELTSQIKYFVPEVKIAPKPPNKLGLFYSKLKQPLPKADLSGVVYQVNCKEKDTKYIGETIQKLGKRTGQHDNDCTAANLAKVNKKRTALACHAKEKKHQFDFDMKNVEVLKRERNKTKLRIQEVNEIVMQEDDVCNFKSDSTIIRPSYGRLLKQFKASTTKRLGDRTKQKQRIHAMNGFGDTSCQSSLTE